jgi:acetyl-CoA synthetase
VCCAQGYYFAGDGARIDADGYIWITGRVDDVINVSGAISAQPWHSF